MERPNFSVPIHQSLTRPQMMMGCDRELYILLIFFSVIFIGPIGLMKKHYFMVIIGVILWLFGTFTLRHMAKLDPRMKVLFSRSLRYDTEYTATGYVDEVVPKYKRW